MERSPVDNLPDDDELLDTLATAKLINMSRQWLELRRCKSDGGPPYRKLGRDRNSSVRYRRGDVRAWMESCRV